MLGMLVSGSDVAVSWLSSLHEFSSRAAASEDKHKNLDALVNIGGKIRDSCCSGKIQAQSK